MYLRQFNVRNFHNVYLLERDWNETGEHGEDNTSMWCHGVNDRGRHVSPVLGISHCGDTRSSSTYLSKASCVKRKGRTMRTFEKKTTLKVFV